MIPLMIFSRIFTITFLIIFSIFVHFSFSFPIENENRTRERRATPVRSPSSRHVTISSEAVDVLLSQSSSLDGSSSQHSLLASFSPVGFNYETSGDVVQVSSFRACDVKRKGPDQTIFGHVAVLFVDEVQPFLTGCVALDNQARFAERSGALALVVGPSSRVTNNLKPLRYRAAKIPVIVLDDAETEQLKRVLETAAQSGSLTKLSLQFVDTRPPYSLRLQVFRPTILNLSLIALLIILVLFISVLVVVKLRCKPNAHRDIWMRALARSALHKMEIRKYSKPSATSRKSRLPKFSRTRPNYLPVFGSLTSVAHTVAGQDRCAICLDDYSEGAELRVLFCGHEFHPKCVDPWLLSNRRCPLCQFDVVCKAYPNIDEEKMGSDDSTPSAPLLQPTPPTPQRIGGRMNENTVPVVQRVSTSTPIHSGGQPSNGRVKRTPTRTRSVPRRRPLRSREELLRVTVGPLGHVSGYSSDVSSYPDCDTIVRRIVL